MVHAGGPKNNDKRSLLSKLVLPSDEAIEKRHEYKPPSEATKKLVKEIYHK